MKKDGTTDTNLTDAIRTDPKGAAPAASGSTASGSAAGYTFPKIDPCADSYFDAASPVDDPIYRFGFSSIPELKDLIRARLGGHFSEAEITRLAVEVFKNKPKTASKASAGSAGAKMPIPQEQEDDESRPVDFIYQM